MKKNKREPVTRLWVMMGLMAFAGAVVLAFLYDMTRLRSMRPLDTDQVAGAELADILVQENMRDYADSNGLFVISVPISWRTEYPNRQDQPCNVLFRSSQGFEVSVLVSQVENQTFNGLEHDIRGIEERLGLNMNIKQARINGIPVIRRTINLHYCRVLALDLTQDGLAHHIQISIPNRYADQAEAILSSLFNSYRPRPSAPTTKKIMPDVNMAASDEY